MAKPIIIVGNNRSGTKWLSNTLLNHSDIAGVQDVGHDGIVETEIFTTFPMTFGPLNVLENRIAFIECFAATDYLRCTGFPKEDLYHFQAQTYPDFFRELMDRLAVSRNTSHWLQKFPPTVLSILIAHFSDAQFITIVRDVVPTIRSHLRKWGGPHRLRNALRFLFWYYYGVKRLKWIQNQPGTISIRYEDMIADREGTIRTICQSLDLKTEAGMLENRFQSNSSFADSESPEKFLTLFQEKWIVVWSWVFRLIPGWIYQLIYRNRRHFKSSPRPFYSLSFQLLEKEKGLVRPTGEGSVSEQRRDHPR